MKSGNYFEFEGEPYCEEHFRCKMCPDCVRLRRAQNKFFAGVQNANQQLVPSGTGSIGRQTPVPVNGLQQKTQQPVPLTPGATMPQITTTGGQKVTFSNGTLPHQQHTSTTICTPHQHKKHDLIQHNENLQHKQKLQPLLEQAKQKVEPLLEKQSKRSGRFSIRLGA